MCRSTPSTSSSARTTTSCSAASPPTAAPTSGQAQSVDKSVFEYWTHALAYVPVRDFRFFVPAMKAHRDGADPLVGRRYRGEAPSSSAASAATAPSPSATSTDDELVEKAHLWASKKPSKGAARARLLRWPAGDQRAPGHGQDLRGHRAPFRLEDAAPRRDARRRSSSISSTARLRAQGLVSAPSVMHPWKTFSPEIARSIDRRVRRKATARSPHRRLAGPALGRARKCWTPLPEPCRAARPHPLALRPAGDPARAAEAVLRLRPHLRGLRHQGEAQVRLLHPAGARRRRGRRRCSISRPIAPRGKLLIQAWHWLEHGRPRAHKKLIEEELSRFERFQLGD